MNPPNFPRSTALLLAAALLSVPAAAHAENPFKNLGTRIKSGVSKVATAVKPSNVGSAIKKTARAAKDMVTPGSADDRKAAPVPRALRVNDSKPVAYRTTSPKPTKTSTAPKKETVRETEVTRTPKTKSKAKTVAREESDRSTPHSRSDSRKDDVTPQKKTKKSTPDRDPDQSEENNSKPADPSEPETGTDSPATGDSTLQTSDTAEMSPEADLKPVGGTTLPFGTPAFGRKGYIYSPYAPDRGLINVVDVSAGTKVRCPYTGRTFRVP